MKIISLTVILLPLLFLLDLGTIRAEQRVQPHSNPDLGTMYASSSGSVKKTGSDQAWEPPPPPPDRFDWIQLTSGEWLKGDIKSLYRGTLEFDSDKLGLHEFDWEDVKTVRSAPDQATRARAGRKEERLCGIAQSGLTPGAGKYIILMHYRKDGPRDQVPFITEFKRNHGLNVESNAFTIIQDLIRNPIIPVNSVLKPL